MCFKLLKTILNGLFFFLFVISKSSVLETPSTDSHINN